MMDLEICITEAAGGSNAVKRSHERRRTRTYILLIFAVVISTIFFNMERNEEFVRDDFLAPKKQRRKNRLLSNKTTIEPVLLKEKAVSVEEDPDVNNSSKVKKETLRLSNQTREEVVAKETREQELIKEEPAPTKEIREPELERKEPVPLQQTKVPKPTLINKTAAAPPKVTNVSWHTTWSKPSIDTNVVIEMMSSADSSAVACQDTDSEDCRFHSHNFPFLVRNGQVHHSRVKTDPIQQDGQIRRLQHFEEMLEMALSIAKNNSKTDNRIARVAHGDFPIVLYKDDYRGCTGLKRQPIFTWSTAHPFLKCKGDQDTWAIPSYNLWPKSLESSAEWDLKFQEFHKNYPWDSKKRSAVWRGGTTGFIKKGEIGNWRELPRVQLVKHSMDHPDLIDAAFVKVSSELKSIETEVLSELRFADKIMQRDFMKHRAIIDIDGNSWSSRFANLLCYNSVVIKVQPRDVDYFYTELEPWKHYVPVRANMTNLQEIVEYVLDEENEAQIKFIIRNANRWCQNKLTRTQLATDLMWILVSYVDLLYKGDAEWPKRWKANDTAYLLPSLNMEPIKSM